MPDDLEGESKFQWWARLGFLARGLLYVLIGVLAIATGRTEDLTGALKYLRGGLGGVLLVAVVVGMAGYGLWRLTDAVFAIETPGHDAKALRKRAAHAFSGIVYCLLAYKGAQLILNQQVQEKNAQDHAATALHLPAGAVVLFAAAVILAIAGALQLHKAFTCSFLDNLRRKAVSEPVKWLGRIGYSARGASFLVIGWLVAQAAITQNARPAGGLEQALDTLHGPLQFAVAAGLLLFGLFSMVEARYRTIHDAPSA